MGGKPKYKIIQTTDAPLWDAYVHAHPHGTLYHLYGWRNVIEKTYGHQTYYLAAIKEGDSQYPIPNPHLVGLLPLVHLRSLLFGNNLISMPYVDLGGILADNEEIERALLNRAIKLGQKVKAQTIELRHAQLPSCLNSTNSVSMVSRSHKVRMPLALLDSSERLMTYFKPRLRTKIRKSLRQDLHPQIGGTEDINDFYEVFSTNMRDLGSPVHSKRFMQYVLEEFPDRARIIVIYQESHPMACSLVIGFKKTLESPWVSSMRKFSYLNPNICLYWTMMEYARKEGYSSFEFGRSTLNEGPYQFKKQWGPKPFPLHWYYIFLKGKPISKATLEKSKFKNAIHIWQKLPVSVSKMIGPTIRKHIGL